MIVKKRISFPRLKFWELWKKGSSGLDEKVEIVLRWRNLTMSAVRQCAGNDDLAALFRVGASGALSDVELLAQFTGKNDRELSEAAFAALVARHGRMVQGVCRRILGDAHDTDDAFQATFLILAARPGRCE